MPRGSNADRLPNGDSKASPHENVRVRAPYVGAVPARDLYDAAGFDLDQLVMTWTGALRDHSHLANVLTHISRNNWRDVERALRSIFGGSTRGRDLSTLACNIVDLLCADRGLTGRIMKPYFRDFLASELPPNQARRLAAHVMTLFLELEMPHAFDRGSESEKKIAIIQGSSAATAQKLFRDIVERWSPQIRIAGVIEERDHSDGRACRAGRLRDIGDNALYPMFQKAAAVSVGCDVEEAGINSAAAAIQRNLIAGCDVVILSKFGKLEAGGRGLRAAFDACIGAKIPLLTYIPFKLDRALERFADCQSTFLRSEATAIDEWLRSFRSIRDAMTSC